jgi:hypothetical protein
MCPCAVHLLQELDFYACLNELDNSVGAVLDALTRLGYYNNTLTWFTTDNGPEVNCPPVGRCGSGANGRIPPGTENRPDCGGAGSAGPLRGRKRDVWEGGHRVPGIISWPAVVGETNRVSWDPLTTMDFLATIMDVLDVERPAAQAGWAFDGVSVLPVLRGETPPERGIGWMYMTPNATAKNGYAFRWGQWKYVVGGISCDPTAKYATFDCYQPQLYDLSVDYAEENDLAKAQPALLAALAANFSAWQASVLNSIANESKCAAKPGPPGPFPPNPAPADTCDFELNTSLNGADLASGHVADGATCCGACRAYSGCVAADFWDKTPGVNCHLKGSYGPKPAPHDGVSHTACVVPQ